MPNCKNCNDFFPAKMKIDDKICRLDGRKFCLKCNPYRSGGAANLAIDRSIKYTKERLESVCKDCTSVAQVLRKLGLKESGGNYSHIGRRIKHFGIDTSHFLGIRANCGANHKGGYSRTWQEILVLHTSGYRQVAKRLRKALIESGRIYKCEGIGCQIVDTWNNKPIMLQVDHINGNWLDNRPENIRFLCPNCHSQTANWCNVGRKLGKRSYYCVSCFAIISSQGERCKSCAAKLSRKPKIQWPTYDELIEALKTTPYTTLGKQLGVSDNAIRRHLRTHKPPDPEN